MNSLLMLEKTDTAARRTRKTTPTIVPQRNRFTAGSLIDRDRKHFETKYLRALMLSRPGIATGCMRLAVGFAPR